MGTGQESVSAVFQYEGDGLDQAEYADALGQFGDLRHVQVTAALGHFNFGNRNLWHTASPQ